MLLTLHICANSVILFFQRLCHYFWYRTDSPKL